MRVTVPTLDDALLRCYEVILSSGASIGSTRGANREVVGAQIELTNPFARLSLSESRSTLYSCLGEFLWYLARSDDIGFIKYYAPKYAEFVDVIDGKVPEAYGPRLFAWHGIDQVTQVIELLRERSASRQAVIQLFDRNDLSNGRRDVPCTCTLQFLLRENRLDAITMMRSNDAVRGLPHDLFAFTMLQELIARSLGVEPGIYRHWVGSLHIYERDGVIAQALIAEGWQSTIGTAMPPMPEGNPWQYIKQLLEAEYAFRVERRAEPWGSTGSRSSRYRFLSSVAVNKKPVMDCGRNSGKIREPSQVRDSARYSQWHWGGSRKLRKLGRAGRWPSSPLRRSSRSRRGG